MFQIQVHREKVIHRMVTVASPAASHSGPSSRLIQHCV